MKMEHLIPLDKDYYCVEEDPSDREYESDSSEDEVQKYFANIAGVSSSKKKDNTAENDEFEREMENDLSDAFDARNVGWIPKQQNLSTMNPVVNDQPSSSGTTAISNSRQRNKEENKQQKVWGSGDSDEDVSTLKNNEPSDADLFYDPKSDEDNQNWIDSHRRRNYQVAKKLPNSDAVLNCPCCMGVLCYDCQRHDVYHTQYRAMFVVNCELKENQVLFQPTERSKRRKVKELKLKSGETLEAAPEGCDSSDIFRPVVCAHCKTEVAVYDCDEVYHFFNVLASHS